MTPPLPGAHHPGDTHMLTTAQRVEAAADLSALPFTRITETAGQAHVFAASLDELTAWWTALGGHATCRDAGPAVRMWTLHTDLGDILALFAKNVSDNGGETMIASSSRIYNELSSTRPDLLQELGENWDG